MQALLRLHDKATDVGAMLATLCVAITACIYTAEVVGRYFLNAPLNWSGDVSSYLLCATTFLALPKVTSEGGHIAITYLLERTDEHTRVRYAYIIRLVTGLVCLATAIYVAIEGVQLFAEHVLTTPATQIPKWWIALLAFLGIGSSALHLLFGRGDLGQRDAAV